MRIHFSLVPLLLCVACSESKQDSGPVPIPVTVYEVEDQHGGGLERYSADFEPYSLVRVRPQVDGEVVEISRREGADGTSRELQGGDRVAAGEVLLKVDDSIYAERVGKSEAELADQTTTMQASKDQYDRMLSAGDAVAQSQVENTKALWESAQARVARAQHGLDIAKIDLARCTVSAPSAGLLLSRAVEVGDTVSKGTLLFELADTSRMKLVFDVPAAMAAGFQDGTLLHCDVSALDDREYAGPITRISPSADPRSRLFEVEITINNADGALKVGMIATLALQGGVADSGAAKAPVLVPIDAIVRPPNESAGFAVYLLSGAETVIGDIVSEGIASEGIASEGIASEDIVSGEGKVSLRTVEVGDVLGSLVVVESGLASGDRVVVRGSTIVTEGATVRVIP